jgi:hypothetical protein
VESLEQKLALLDLVPDTDLDFEFHRVRVPAGEEMWKITYLQFFYKAKLLQRFLGQRPLTQEFLNVHSRSDYQFTVVPNSLLTLTTRPVGNTPVRATNFAFSSFHQQYRSLIGISTIPPHDLDQVIVAILDSGVADDNTLTIANGRNFVDPRQFHGLGEKGLILRSGTSKKITDENGRGTVISLILHDLLQHPSLSFIKLPMRRGEQANGIH